MASLGFKSITIVPENEETDIAAAAVLDAALAFYEFCEICCFFPSELYCLLNFFLSSLF